MSEALPLAMQHVVAMIVGCVTPAIIVSGAVPGGLSREDPGYPDPVGTGHCSIVNFASAVSDWRKGEICNWLRPADYHGCQLCLRAKYAGDSESYGIAAIMGAEIVGGIVAVVMGLLVKKIRVFFPPLITGTVVFTIGLSLYPTAINYMAGGTQQSELRILAELGNCIFHADLLLQL